MLPLQSHFPTHLLPNISSPVIDACSDRYLVLLAAARPASLSMKAQRRFGRCALLTSGFQRMWKGREVPALSHSAKSYWPKVWWKWSWLKMVKISVTHKTHCVECSFFFIKHSEKHTIQNVCLLWLGEHLINVCFDNDFILPTLPLKENIWIPKLSLSPWFSTLFLFIQSINAQQTK